MSISFNKRFHIFYNFFVYFFKIFFLAVLTFTAFRIAFLWVYGSKAQLEGNYNELFYAFITGLRFDVNITSFGMLLPLLLTLSLLFVNADNLLYQKFIRIFFKYYGILLLFIFSLISFVDFYFYKFFQFHINILFFGIVNDDTLSVLKSVWTDYPVIKISAFLCVMMIGFYYTLKKTVKKQHACILNNKYIQILSVILFCILYFIGMRGSLGTFPIENEDSIISDNTFINTLTLNGIFAFKTALNDKELSSIDINIQKKIQDNGFASPQEAVSTYINACPSPSLSLEECLLQETSYNELLEKNPPHVIFIQMESFGSYYLDLHSPTLNVLGKLEEQLPNCFMFRNFLSCTSGTIHSLEGLMIGSPLTPISQSIYMNCQLSSSVALPFKNKGYNTHFVTSSELGWRNLDKFVPRQYFENTEGSEFLLKHLPNASRCEWGVYDEFLFDRMFQIINEATKPQFIFSMTTTNHTPFSLPDSYKPYPVNIPANIAEQLRTEHAIAVKNFTNYQYANDCLGRFIEKIKNSPCGKNTIIAASGDHNTLQLFSFYDKQLLDKFSVPFILYIPPKYIPPTAARNTKHFGSHKDIFPTLFNIALSKSKYLKTGVNLLDTALQTNFGMINYDVAMNDNGCVYLSAPSYFKWSDTSKKYLQPTTLEETPELKKLLLQARANKACMTYYIQTDIKKMKAK